MRRVAATDNATFLTAELYPHILVNAGAENVSAIRVSQLPKKEEKT